MEEQQERVDLKNKYRKMLNKFMKMTTLDKSNLSDEMAKNSSRMFVINVTKADADYFKDKAEQALALIEAQVDKKIRKSSKTKLSEAAIKQAVQRNPVVIQARDRYLEARWKFNVCWAAASSIAQKGDQLSNLGHNYRKELEHGFRKDIKEANETARNLTKKKS